tara:strand:+ start:6146 stop:7024 length:879 start_codon:yes stop_codon:yes gene_type:complete
MSYKNEIDTVVFPVAGIGSRFLPATKSVPKELLPILNRPLIEYAFEEAMQSGIEKFIFINSPEKQSITSHFKTNKKLEEILKIKSEFLYSLISKYIIPKEKIVEVVQSEPMGLGHAIWCARDYIDNKAFAVILPDDLIYSEVPCIKQLINTFRNNKKSIVALQEVQKNEISKYGIIEHKKNNNNIYNISNMVEKPNLKDAPSNLAIIGRYILLPEVIEELSENKLGHGGEIQLTDAIKNTIKTSGVIGYEFEGSRYDCGNVIGALEAQISLALKDDKYKNSTKELLKKYNKK